MWDVIIVGAGVAGCSAAYHLQQAGINNLCIIETAPRAGEGLAPRHSGSCTMDPNVAPCVKMMVQVYASTSLEFVHHHGMEGAKRYLTATRQGLALQKKIAHEIWQSSTSEHLTQLGSYCVAYPEDEAELREEYDILLQLGCGDLDGMQWCDKARLSQVEGLSDKFGCGIYFPKEAVIDSSLYAKTLLQHVLDHSEGKAQFKPNSPVKAITQTTPEEGATVVLESGEILQAKHVVVATGALHPHPQLNGLVKPCYSYLVHVPTTNEACPKKSPNFWTWRFTHDWCYTNGKIRMSGEDHFSAYLPPKVKERCANLSKWTLEHYHCQVNDDAMANYPQQYGLYSETPDLAPLIGPLPNQPRICYLLGCNAWGQTILSYCSSLVPGLLGYTPLTEEQEDGLKLVSIQRFSELHK